MMMDEKPTKDELELLTLMARGNEFTAACRAIEAS